MSGASPTHVQRAIVRCPTCGTYWATVTYLLGGARWLTCPIDGPTLYRAGDLAPAPAARPAYAPQHPRTDRRSTP